MVLVLNYLAFIYLIVVSRTLISSEANRNTRVLVYLQVIFTRFKISECLRESFII